MDLALAIEIPDATKSGKSFLLEKMSKSGDHLLSVRGLVIDKESKVIAIINFADLTKGII
jgi:hypothetical protein